MSDTNTSEGAAFEPRPMSDVLRSDPAPTREEPAGRPEPTAAPQTTSDPGEKPAPQADRNRDDAGRFAPRGEQQGAPPAPEQNAPQMVPVSAVLEERKKRQALEARLREMETAPRAPAPPQQMPPQQPAQPEVPLPDLIFQDPERFVQVQRAAFEQEMVDRSIAISEHFARQAPDWPQAEQAFIAWVEASPQNKAAAVDALRKHPLPALLALEHGRKVLAAQNWGQVTDRYRSPDEFRAALLQEIQQQPPAPAPRAPAAPPPPASLASVRSAGPRTAGAPPWNGPRPISAILGTRR